MKVISGIGTVHSLKPGNESGVEELLSAVRPKNAIPVPWELLVQEPLPGTVDWKPEHPYDAWVYDLAGRLGNVKDRVIVFDLDDTLLNTNYICGDEWHVRNTDPECHLSIDYSRLRRSRSYWLKAGWRKPIRQRYDSSRYPFLRNPEVEAQLRPGTIALLAGLKEAGAQIVLATLTARMRLQFIFDRIPSLCSLFFDTNSKQLNVVCAEDLASCTLAFAEEGVPDVPSALSGELREQWIESQSLHRKHSTRFNLKTLIVLNKVLGLERLDLLIDDSEAIATDYSSPALSPKFIRAEALQPMSPVTARLLRNLERQDNGKEDPAPDGEALPSLDGYPFLRFEDPLYYPLVHVSDRIPGQKEHIQ